MEVVTLVIEEYISDSNSEIIINSLSEEVTETSELLF